MRVIESLWQIRKEVILKSILTVAAGTLLVAASGVSACPYMDANQKVTELDSHDQKQQSLVEHKGYEANSDLLAELQQDKEKATN